jgi:preprotein translocase subunit YajC
VQGNIVYLAAAQQTNPLVSFLPFALIIAALYFFLLRPQNRRRREQMQMQSSVEPGSRVVTTSGMHGTVIAVDDDGLLLEVAPGVQIRFVKQAVMQVLRDDADDADDAEDAGEPAEHDEAIDLTKDDAKDHADDGDTEVEDGKGSEGSDKKTPGKPSA